ncbi:hypothetical protein O6H91_09G057200 [Diphasiastrum complanatum]|uniref:Uncharacterized protein n=1 Tax=Diphasiastrum complanatum TaxID=34168 RepID=A0ACC2CPQ9_DIPCM|nr:hypothetical protein O6H91_09G057200 [Diphasiastrum complanatum]
MRSLHSGRGPAMAAPSSSSSPSSIFSPFLDPHPGADALLGWGEQCGAERSNWREMACSMAPDRDAFVQPAEQTPTLREHDAALCLIENLDEFWFFDSVVRWPRNSSSSSTSTSSREDLQSLPPFQSIEMVHPDSSFAAVCNLGNKELLPRPRFGKSEYVGGQFPVVKASDGDSSFAAVSISGNRELLPRLRFEEAEYRGAEFPILKPSDDDDDDGDEKIKPECSREQSSATVHEISSAESRLNVFEPHLDEIESEEASVQGRKQADERLEAHASPVKQDTTTLMTLKLEALKPMKKVPIPSGPSSANLRLSRRHRRRKDRKNKSKGTEHVEHDEVKGFKELGFSFSQDKLTPRVISLFPGMKVDYGEGKNQPEVSFVASAQYKLYNSPAWWAVKPNSPLYNWQFPDPHQEGVDMKAHLKFWARAVASTARQEC